MTRNQSALFHLEPISAFQSPVHARDRLRIHACRPQRVIQVLHRPENRLLLCVLSFFFPCYEVPMLIRHNV